MEDNELNEKEKKAVENNFSKEISNKIKTMPLKYKLIILGIIIGVLSFLLIFVGLALVIAALFDIDVGGSSSGGTYVSSGSTGVYWWPIGGSEIEIYEVEEEEKEFATGAPTTTVVSSLFDPNRKLTNSQGQIINSPHYAIDISASGTHYIIASEEGRVYTAMTGCDNNGSIGNYCNGGLGNFVILSHYDGSYTVYGHMKDGSLKVETGDVVGKGQILGIMGNSGNSSGQHLHFQLEIGGRGNQFAVNPLDYVFADAPRRES